MTQPTDPAIDEVASDIITIEQTAQPARPPNAAIMALLANPDRNPFRNWCPPARAIRCIRIPDAMLDGGFRGIFTDAGLVQATRYLTPDSYFQTLRRTPDTLLRPPDDEGPVIVGCNSAYTNYFHWVTQALPAIDLALRRDGQAPDARLALPPLRPWQEQSLQLLGHGSVRRVEITDRDRQYAFGVMEHCNVLTGAGAFTLSSAVAQTYQRLREAAPRPQGSRKIYVSRTDSTHRIMRNEQSLIAGLVDRGFEILEAGSLDFAEQVARFQDAGFVVGPHGAGLTNIAFCHPGTFVYELVPQHYTNSCFCLLALLGRLSYWADQFASEGPEEVPPFLREWQSDTEAALARVDEIEALRARQAIPDDGPVSAMDFLRGRSETPPPSLSTPTPVDAPSPAARWWRWLRWFRRRER
jgi:hypothetical protein